MEEVKSPTFDSTNPVVATFHNGMQRPMSLYWVRDSTAYSRPCADDDSSLVLQATVPPGHASNVNTFHGHRFVAKAAVPSLSITLRDSNLHEERVVSRWTADRESGEVQRFDVDLTVAVKWQNQLAHQVAIYWLPTSKTSEGSLDEPVKQGFIKPGRSLGLRTHIGHNFEVRSVPANEHVMFWIASAEVPKQTVVSAELEGLPKIDNHMLVVIPAVRDEL
jgi:hypothetical protein